MSPDTLLPKHLDIIDRQQDQIINRAAVGVIGLALWWRRIARRPLGPSTTGIPPTRYST